MNITVEPASLHPGSLHDPDHCSFWLTPIVYICTIRNPHHCTTRIIAHFGWFPRSCNNAGSTVCPKLQARCDSINNLCGVRQTFLVIGRCRTPQRHALKKYVQALREIIEK